MKANELRIGNFVNEICGNRTELVTFDYSVYEAHDINGKVSFDDCFTHLEPITLTKEWLVKFGFEDDYPYIVLNGKLKIKNGVWFYKYHLLEIELRYVHQLQNLYFSLTGEELTI